jgi:hypothetical protein
VVEVYRLGSKTNHKLEFSFILWTTSHTNLVVPVLKLFWEVVECHRAFCCNIKRSKMRKLDPVVKNIFSDFCINLAAGWFGAAFIIPAISGKDQSVNIIILMINIVLATLCLSFAYKLRKK